MSRRGRDGYIVAVVNQKGGVGKTTLTVHLAEYMARKHRKRVVVVDADAQGNLSSWLLGEMSPTSGLYDALVARQDIRDQVVDVARVLQEKGINAGPWHISLVPGNWETSEAMRFITSGGWSNEYIAEKVRPLAKEFDLVFLDTPPSRMAGFRELLLAANGLVVPTTLERMGLDGVVLLGDVVAKLEEKHGYAPRLIGIVPNMVRRRTREHMLQRNMLVNVFGDSVWPDIPNSVRVAEASSRGKTLFDWAPKEEVTQRMKEVCELFAQTLKLIK